jgi:antitoxin (DNA-binding transcriptional repressor) of toxin-antitoxin stability system
MVVTIPIRQAGGQLVELLRDLAPDDQIGLTEGGRLVGRIVPETPPANTRRPGACKGMLEIMDDGDDEVLEHFKAYLP